MVVEKNTSTSEIHPLEIIIDLAFGFFPIHNIISHPLDDNYDVTNPMFNHKSQRVVLWENPHEKLPGIQRVSNPSCRNEEMSNAVHSLQHTATHCNILQDTATPWLCSTLQHTATYCNTLQHTATHCNLLQRTATYCNTLHHADSAANCNTMTSRNDSSRPYIVKWKCILFHNHIIQSYDLNIWYYMGWLRFVGSLKL